MNSVPIDAHQHFWRIARGDYGWLTPDLAPLYRDYGPADLAPFLTRHGIARTILVQAAPTVAETDYMLRLAEETPFVAGVVGWVDFEADDAALTIERLARNELLVGLRPMVHDIPDDEWLAQAPIGRAIDAMRAHDLVFDALTRPQHLSSLLTFVDRYPGLAVVIDHVSKPRIAEREMDPWRADIGAIAARPNTACKISGMATEAGGRWSADDLRPYVEHTLSVFGAQRLMWGSDWPVVNLAGGYDRWRGATRALLEHLHESDRDAILGGVAGRIYLTKRGRRA